MSLSGIRRVLGTLSPSSRNPQPKMGKWNNIFGWYSFVFCIFFLFSSWTAKCENCYEICLMIPHLKAIYIKPNIISFCFSYLFFNILNQLILDLLIWLQLTFEPILLIYWGPSKIGIKNDGSGIADFVDCTFWRFLVLDDTNTSKSLFCLK